MSRSPLTDVTVTGAATAEGVLEAHAERLAGVVEAVGVDAVAGSTGLSRDVVEGVAAGDVDAVGGLDLHDAAAVLALDEGAPSADAIVDRALEDLLFGMTAGVLDVDRVAGEVAADLDPREVQGMLERRHPVTLREFASLQAVIVGGSG